jgi:hypothetical protein
MQIPRHTSGGVRILGLAMMGTGLRIVCLLVAPRVQGECFPECY